MFCNAKIIGAVFAAKDFVRSHWASSCELHKDVCSRVESVFRHMGKNKQTHEVFNRAKFEFMYVSEIKESMKQHKSKWDIKKEKFSHSNTAFNESYFAEETHPLHPKV